MTSKNLDLCKGETVIIENYGEDISYINIYFPIDNNENLFVNNVNIKK